MWIKTKHGDFYNMEHCRQIYLDNDGYTCFCMDGVTLQVEGDYRETIIQNIVSETKIMEV